MASSSAHAILDRSPYARALADRFAALKPMVDIIKQDNHFEALFSGCTMVGFIAYKISPEKTLQVSQLMVAHGKSMVPTCETLLMTKIDEIAQREQARVIQVCVSSNMATARTVFQQHGYTFPATDLNKSPMNQYLFQAEKTIPSFPSETTDLLRQALGLHRKMLLQKGVE